MESYQWNCSSNGSACLGTARMLTNFLQLQQCIQESQLQSATVSPVLPTSDRWEWGNAAMTACSVAASWAEPQAMRTLPSPATCTPHQKVY